MWGYAGFRIDSMIVIQFRIPYLYCYSNNLKADFSGELHLEPPADATDANLQDQEYINRVELINQRHRPQSEYYVNSAK